MTKKIHIIIVAAGSGSRFGGPLPKQFCDLGGKPVLMRTIESCRGVLPGIGMTLVLSEEMLDYWHMLCDTLQFDSPDITVGGDTRFESVRRGLATVEPGTDIIMVHDGARPFPTRAIFHALVEALEDKKCHGAIPAISVTDSLRKLTADKSSSNAVDRSDYRAVQTPQAFQAKLLIEANAKAAKNDVAYTDDASVMEAAGYSRLCLVPGDVRNIKITNPGDLALANFYLHDFV